MCFPEKWTVTQREGEDFSKVTASQDNTDGVGYSEISVVVIPDTAPDKLSRFMNADIEIARNLGSSSEVIGNRTIKLKGREVAEVEISVMLRDNKKMRLLNYGFASRNNLYFIRCLSSESFYKKYGKVFRTAAETFSTDAR